MQKPTKQAPNRARLGVLSAWALRGAFEEGALSTRPFLLAEFLNALERKNSLCLGKALLIQWSIFR
jgi:hypothetical protein